MGRVRGVEGARLGGVGFGLSSFYGGSVGECGRGRMRCWFVKGVELVQGRPEAFAGHVDLGETGVCV